MLSAWLWESGEVTENDTDLPRRLKDRVARAINGTSLPPSTLSLFLDAFAISENDVRELWDLLLQPDFGESQLVVRHRSRLGATSPSTPATYRTLSLHEFHTVGADRCPAHHRTVQVIRATERMATYRYRFDTSAAVVQVLRGGTATTVSETSTPGIFAADIVLNQPLAPGETASLEYRTIFTYGRPPEPAFRRVALRKAENLELNVEFSATKPPRHVWWCTWTDLTADSLASQESVQLDVGHTVHRYLAALEGAGAGFRWQW